MGRINKKEEEFVKLMKLFNRRESMTLIGKEVFIDMKTMMIIKMERERKHRVQVRKLR